MQQDELIVAAYLAIAKGETADGVIVDPGLNSQYLAECAKLQVQGTPRELNRRLLNIRKSGKLPRTGKSKKARTKSTELRIACEVAARQTQVKFTCSLDDVLCDPQYAGYFDGVAAEICPGHELVEYRWVALRLRKAKKLKPETTWRLLPPVAVSFNPIRQLQLESVPQLPGIYVFSEEKSVLYVGESERLRARIAKHLDHSDNKGLARWFWQQGIAEAVIELYVLPPGTTTTQRRAIEQQVIQLRNPRFNVR